jgi:hypothetical protein
VQRLPRSLLVQARDFDADQAARPIRRCFDGKAEYRVAQGAVDQSFRLQASYQPGYIQEPDTIAEIAQPRFNSNLPADT